MFISFCFKTVSSLKEGTVLFTSVLTYSLVLVLEKYFLIDGLTKLQYLFLQCMPIFFFHFATVLALHIHLCEADLWEQKVNILWQVIFTLIANVQALTSF